MNEEKERIDNIVAMLDRFMSEGGGHMNVVMNEGTVMNETTVETFRSADCGSAKTADGMPAMACQVPTLHQGMEP